MKIDHFAELERRVGAKLPATPRCDSLQGGNVQSGQEKGGDSQPPNETNEAWRGERRLAGRRNEGEVR